MSVDMLKILKALIKKGFLYSETMCSTNVIHVNQLWINKGHIILCKN